MSRPNCEEIRVAAMALADGEQAPLTAADMDEHLAACAACREEVRQMTALARLLSRQARPSYAEDLWPGLARRLEAAGGAPLERRGQTAIWPLALLLGAYKLIEFVPDRSWPPVIQLLPLLIAAVWLVWQKQNPFRVEVDFSMEGGE